MSGKPTVFLVAAIGLAAALATPQPATAEGEEPPKVTANPPDSAFIGILVGADSDKSGGIDRTEWAAYGQTSFDKVDGDKNGSLSGGELAVTNRGDGTASTLPSGGPASEAGFNRLDADRNGAISAAEFEGMHKQAFAALDTDGDGFLKPSDQGAEDFDNGIQFKW